MSSDWPIRRCDACCIFMLTLTLSNGKQHELRIAPMPLVGPCRVVLRKEAARRPFLLSDVSQRSTKKISVSRLVSLYTNPKMA